jgi:hypothetical protein
MFKIISPFEEPVPRSFSRAGGIGGCFSFLKSLINLKSKQFNYLFVLRTLIFLHPPDPPRGGSYSIYFFKVNTLDILNPK